MPGRRTVIFTDSVAVIGGQRARFSAPAHTEGDVMFGWTEEEMDRLMDRPAIQMPGKEPITYRQFAARTVALAHREDGSPAKCLICDTPQPLVYMGVACEPCGLSLPHEAYGLICEAAIPYRLRDR